MRLTRLQLVDNLPAQTEQRRVSLNKSSLLGSQKHYYMSRQPINKNRYSDKELIEFEKVIEGKLDEAKNQLKALSDQLQELSESEDIAHSGSAEGGAVNQQVEQAVELAARQQKFIRNLEYALIRIKNKTYGICAITGERIDKKRLALVPHATKSIEGKYASQGRAKFRQKPLRERDF